MSRFGFFTAFAGTITVALLSACTSGGSDELRPSSAISAPAMIALQGEPSPSHPPARPCLIGTSDCRDLDSRPFAPCLLTSERCPQSAEMMRVPQVPADSAAPPGTGEASRPLERSDPAPTPAPPPR
jgi:hypothetical protein